MHEKYGKTDSERSFGLVYSSGGKSGQGRWDALSFYFVSDIWWYASLLRGWRCVDR